MDRASKWRQFWTMTVPMVLPFLMLAVLFRGIENFKMFDLVVQLTGGGPGATTLLTSIDLKREAFEKWRTGYQLGLCGHPVRDGLRPCLDLREGPEQGEGKMSAYSITEPSRRQKWIAGVLVIVYAVDHAAAAALDHRHRLQDRRRIPSPIRPR